MQPPLRNIQVYLALCGIGLVVALTLLGPRPAEGLGTPQAVVFWMLHVVPALILLESVQMWVVRQNRLASLPAIWQFVLGGLMASVLFTPVALMIDRVFGAPISAEAQTECLFLQATGEFLQFAGPVTITWLLINAPALVQLPRSSTGAAAAAFPERGGEVSAPDELEDFWARVPHSLGRTIVAMSAELHYLRVFTTKGDALILCSLGRAMEMLRNTKGCQIHRSHWVNLDHVESVTGATRSTRCRLSNGLELPVSRERVASVRAAVSANG